MRKTNIDTLNPLVQDNGPLFDQSQSRDEAAKEMGRYAEGVRETSKQAYKEHSGSGAKDSQINKIYTLLLRSKLPMSRREISRATGIENSAVAGRVTGMLEGGLLEECGARKCSISGKLINQLRAI
jgi:hypothetical protein